MDAPDDLDRRLRAAKVPAGAAPLDAWRQLHAVEGARATVIDLYILVARGRGVAAEDLPGDERNALAAEVMPDVWPGFQTAAGSVRRHDPIVVVEHESTWADRYEHWRTAIATALGATAERIEHVGSTAVPGLPAKPVIDIQVSVADIGEEQNYVPQLEALGIQLRSRDDLHRYFRPFPDRPRDVQVHVCATASSWERDHVLFRDHLRRDAEARQRYAAVKLAAARRWREDRIAYTDAKSAVILELLEQARIAEGHRPQ